MAARSRSRSPPAVGESVPEPGLASDVQEETEEDLGFVEQCGSAGKVSGSPSLCWPCLDDGRPNGPTNYEEMHGWLQHIVKRIGQADPSGGCLELLKKNLQRKVFLTTHYSGMGTAEMAAGFVESGVLGHDPEMTAGSGSLISVHAANEYAPHAQEVLVAHSGAWAPRHVFGDLCFPVPIDLQEKWRRMLKAARRKVDEICEVLHGEGRCSSTQRARLVERAGEHFVGVVLADLNKLTFCRDMKQYCFKCKKFCPRFPSASSICDGLLVDISGSTCVGFSKAGSRWAWLDDSAVPFMVWAWTMKSVRPQLILHECVASFDPKTLDLALNYQEPVPAYAISSVVFDASDLGLPVSRLRRYTLCRMVSSDARVDYTYTNLAAVTFRRLLLDGSVYFRASEAMLDEMNQELARNCHLPPTNGGRRWPWSALLRVCAYRRLQYARQNRKSDSPETFCSVSQSEAFMSITAGVVPTLTTNSAIHRISNKPGEDRPAAPLEYFAMQNIPALLPEGHQAAKHFAFRGFVEKGLLPIGHCRVMTGNGMNLAVVGSVLCFGLATIEFR